MLQVKAALLLKRNVDALLRERGQKRKDLAQWCRRSEGWLSKLMGDEARNVPVKYLDRIADFFGIATYQLFQPGISHLTERRSGRDRRTGRDRRISQSDTARPRHMPEIETVTPWERALLARVRKIAAHREALRHLETTIEMAERSIIRPNTEAPAAPWDHTVGKPALARKRPDGK